MVLTLGQITAAAAEKVGGKAANCARLFKAGFPVPDGIVVAASADPSEVQVEQDVDGLLTHSWFAAQPGGQRFAVRSSAIGEDGSGHSFAGIHETFLNVERASVPDAVRACRDSVSSKQALAYRAARGLAHDTRTGVLIQPMVDAVVSGVAFTVHPVSGADELLINAAPGLGEELVSGRIEPDEFSVRKADFAVLASRFAAGRTAASAGSMTEADLRELSALLVRIERHYGAPQDVEWCRDKRQLWILQSRPVTTARSAPMIQPAEPKGQPVRSAGVDIEWSRANLAEVFPDQMSPQAVHAYEQLLVNGQRKFLGRMLGPESVLGPPFKAFAGRLYVNMSQLRHVVTISGSPPSGVLRSLGHADAIQPADEIAVRAPLGEILRCLPDLFRLAWLDFRSEAVVRAQDAENDASIRSFNRDDPRSLDDRAIWGRLTQWWSVGPDRMQVILLLGSMVFLEDMLRNAARAAGQPYDALVYPHLAAGEPSVSTQQAFDLVELADIARGEPSTAWYFIAGSENAHDFRQQLAGSRFLPLFEQFLERYGHRGLYESDYGLPRYREDPSALFFAIRSHLQHPPAESRASIERRLADDAHQAWAAFDAGLSPWQRVTLKPRVRRLLARLKKRYVMREHCRSNLTRALYYARQWHLVLAQRFAERQWLTGPRGYFLLFREEIDDVLHGRRDPSSLAAIATARSRQLEAERQLKMPLLMRQSEVPAVLAGRVTEPHEALTERLDGLCVSRGFVEAEAVVIHDPREFQLMRKGAVLVAPATDPSWTPLFTLASGVIVEVGGMLSHASTVAREYGLPALANVRQATSRLKTGDRVRLNASAGFVQRLADKEGP